MQNLYEDKCTGTIPQTVFQTLMRKYEAERAEKAAAIPELEQKVRAQLENRQDANRWMEVIRRYTGSRRWTKASSLSWWTASR